MENSFKSIIDKSQQILILLPDRPFFNQVAAGLSLYLSLKDQKKVDITCPAEMTVEFNRLVAVNKVSTELGSKNLGLRFAGYQANNIERVSYDIENGEFKLTIIPKPGVKPPKKEQIDFSYTGLSADTVLLIGGANENHFPAISKEDFAGVKLVHLGPKELSVSQDKDILSFARPATSAAEIIASLIKESGLKIDADIATNLMMGLEEGSDNFSDRNTTAETFELAAYLMRNGGQREAQSKENKNYPPGSVPGDLDKNNDEEPPEEWMEPKIYKGNTVS